MNKFWIVDLDGDVFQTDSQEKAHDSWLNMGAAVYEVNNGVVSQFIYSEESRDEPIIKELDFFPDW